MNFKNSFFPGNKIIYNILVSKIAQKANKKKQKKIRPQNQIDADKR